ncbi:MAG: glycoside hydrolase family 9 protein [Gammaproteobacteria bacterium]
MCSDAEQIVRAPVTQSAWRSLQLAWVALIGFGFGDVFAEYPRVTTPSSEVITVTLDGPMTQHDALEAGAFTLSASNGGVSPRVLVLGRDQKARGFRSDGSALIEGRIHLLLDAPLSPGSDYQLGTDQGALWDAPLDVSYSPTTVSPSIQVNQVGYLPRGRKLAYVGNWLGTQGPMALPSATSRHRFRVIATDTERTVFRGSLALRATLDPWTGNDVWETDFTALRTPGRYRIEIDGLGRSHPFRIGDDVYRAVYRTIGRLYFHSRNGTAIPGSHADPGYARPRGGIRAELDGIIHPAATSNPLPTSLSAKASKPVSGGWFDAGDYGQYITNAAPVWFNVAAALDIAPHAFRDGDLDIPENGNGIPDMLDELRWGFRWARSMQDADGGVFWRIASERWDEVPPDQVTTRRYIYEKTTHATASFAAMAAIHARLLRAHAPGEAADAEQAALNAWDYLESHPQWPDEGAVYRNPEGTAAGTYPDKSAFDNRLWAAAELLRTTGDTRFENAFRSLLPRAKIDPTSPVTFKEQGMAALWAYLQSPEPTRDPDIERKARRHITRGADWLIRMSDAHPYRAPSHHRIDLTGWGSFAQSTRAVLPLLQAYALTGEARYREYALLMPNPQLGANPESLSFITGLGASPPRHPLSKLSRFSPSDTPLAGLPVPGPHYRLGGAWTELRSASEAYFPVHTLKAGAGPLTAYPALRRYIDSDKLPPMSEPTVAEYAQSVAAYALLNSLSGED